MDRILMFIILNFFLNFLCADIQRIDCSEYPLLQITPHNQGAVNYVGSRKNTAGRTQLEILRIEGLKKDSLVLDMGCGALVGGIPIMSYLETDHYVGVDPNRELMAASMAIPYNLSICKKKRPKFLYVDDFDASALGIRFDYVMAHSVMSHAAQYQLDLFLRNSSKVLKNGGKVIFSLRLTQPNKWGNLGADHETNSPHWVYPQASYFHLSTILNAASRYFSEVRHVKEYTAIVTESDPTECHDWIVATYRE
jgi:cyclopropane fatty-acyl-phospholipid synthase-like methyltransferase